MQILLAVDGSKYSIDAVKFLTGHMHWVRDKPQVDLVYVHPPVPKLSGLGAVIGKKQLEADKITPKATLHEVRRDMQAAKELGR